MNKEIAHSVARNTTVQMGQQLVTWTSSFLLMLFLPRYLGPVNYGRLYLALSVSGIFLMLVDFDGRIGVAKRIARSKEESAQTAVNAVALRTLFWVVAFIGMMSFAFLAHYPPTVKILIAIFAVEILWLGLRTIMWGIFLGHEMAQYSTIGNISERIFIAGVGIAALLLGANVIGMALIMVAGTFLNFLLCIRYSRLMVRAFPAVEWSGVAVMVREGVPYLLWTIFGAIYYRIDSVMLSFLTPEAVVGWYGASYKFFDVLAFLPSIYSLSILPVLSRLWGKEEGMLQKTTQKSLEFILMAGIPISIMVFFSAEFIIQFFFGLSAYAPSVSNLKIFSAGLLLIYLDMVLGTTLFACDKQKQWAAVAFFAVILNVSLNFFLIPFAQAKSGNGGAGAAIATIVTELFVMICALVIMPKSILEGARISPSLKALGAGGMMIASLWGMQAAGLPWAVLLIGGSLVYVLSLVSFRALDRGELEFVKNFLSLRNLRETFAVNRGVSA